MRMNIDVPKSLSLLDSNQRNNILNEVARELTDNLSDEIRLKEHLEKFYD
jgi:hypothetical protein